MPHASPRNQAQPYLRAGGKRPLPGRALGQFLPKVTKKAFEKYGFATATLATDWSMIVGEDLAAKAVPERMSWPRIRTTDADDLAAGCGRNGATLILRVKPAHALEVQYAVGAIMDRINGYFGYRAVEKVKVHQGDFETRDLTAKAARGEGQATDARSAREAPAAVADVRNDRLKSALERLAANVQRR
jgi:hypothetical protein